MKCYFPEIKDCIPYEGAQSRNPLAFRYYNPKRIVSGKPMAEHLKFAVAYWHTFRGTGGDPFGGTSYERPWGTESDPIEAAQSTARACFEFLEKLGVQYYCFHDRDLIPEAETLPQTHRNLEKVVDYLRALQSQSNVRVLWGTANLTYHPRYTHGAATNPDPRIFACAAAQVRHTLDATVALGGTGYVFWGGREGYSSLLNTDMKRERAQLASLLRMSVEYGRSIGFGGKFFIEPKPAEPSTHQYDFDAATAIGFLREFGLMDDFMLNIEANHATLAKHSFDHELQVASDAGVLGSIDINRGNPILGWDTDQFPTQLHDAALAMMIVLKQGGFKFGGLNFDAKVRRGSFDTVDLFHAHIGAMDTLARGLLIADKLIQDEVFSKIISDRYSGYNSEMGEKILSGRTSLIEVEKWGETQGEPPRISGREEALENLLNDYLYSSRIE